MKTTLILCRHGNTFAPEDKVVWTGSSNDLPLVDKGYEQASAVADWLNRVNIRPDILYCGRLVRTKEFAKTISKSCDLVDAQISPYLDEIDYGAWTGLSDAEVIEQFGEEHLNAWRQKSKFPPDHQWNEKEENVVRRVNEFYTMIETEHAGKTILLVSSNGVLRYFLKREEALFQKQITDQSFAVKTGHVGIVEIEAGHLNLLQWNQNPNDL